RDRIRSNDEGTPRCVRDDRRTLPPDPYRMDHGLHVEEPAAGSVSIERDRARWRIDILRREPARLVPARRRLCAQNPARHQASRLAGGVADEVRSRGQPENREGTWTRADAYVHRPRRRGDRMNYPSTSRGGSPWQAKEKTDGAGESFCEVPLWPGRRSFSV